MGPSLPLLPRIGVGATLPPQGLKLLCKEQRRRWRRLLLGRLRPLRAQVRAAERDCPRGLRGSGQAVQGGRHHGEAAKGTVERLLLGGFAFPPRHVLHSNQELHVIFVIQEYANVLLIYLVDLHLFFRLNYKHPT